MPEGSELRLAADDPGDLVWMLRHVIAHPSVLRSSRPGRRGIKDATLQTCGFSRQKMDYAAA